MAPYRRARADKEAGRPTRPQIEIRTGAGRTPTLNQTTLARAFTLGGPGLHTGRRSRVTLRPAPAHHGWRAVAASAATAPVSLAAAQWTPSLMSTSIALGGGRSVRTIEHMMAALSAHGIDNVLVEIDGPEVPIFDGSAAPWCRSLRAAGIARLEAPRRAIRVLRPVQVRRDGGFLRAEPADRFTIDVTHDLLPAFPVMRWSGPVDAARFDAELSRSRSFGNLHRRLGLEPKAVTRPAGSVAANTADPNLSSSDAVWAEIEARRGASDPKAPLLKGWRPWRATLVVGDRLLPWPRMPDEPVRHVALDLIGDLALAGSPLLGRVVAHNPSHEKTYALVAALMAEPEAWEFVEAPQPGEEGID